MLVQFLFRPYFAPDGGGGSGGDGGDPDDAQGKIKPSDVLARYGQTAESALRMAEKLAESENANWRFRERNRVLTQERDEARKQVPAEGGRALTKEEAAAYDAYVVLGKPADLKTAIDAGKTGQERLATLERDALVRAAAEAHGYKPAALGKLPSLTGKNILVEDAQVDGKQIKRAFVQDGNAKIALPDYITQHDPEFVAALAAEPAAPGGIVLPPQGGGTKPPSDLAARFIEQQEARRNAQVNPLMPKQGA